MLYYLSSKSRDSGTPSDYRVNIIVPHPYRKMKLLSLILPLTMYLVGPGNDTISFREGASPLILRTAVLKTGNYSSVTIVGQIQTQMTAAATGPIACIFDTINNTLSITSASPISIEWDAPNSPWKRLGYDEVTSGYQTVHQGTKPIDLSPSGIYHVVFDGLGCSGVSMSSKTSFPSTIPFVVTGNSTEIFHYQNTLPWSVTSTASSFNLGVRLLDDDGKILSLVSEWSCIFYLEQ